MDFSLSFTEGFGLQSRSEQKQQILAAGNALWEQCGLRLTPDDAEMLLQTADHAMQSQELVQFGGGITPLLLHKFMPSGYLSNHPAAQLSELTEAFFRLKGELQALYDEADDPECFLSDYAIMDYMYRFYISPNCAGDAAEMLAQAERILVSGMRRLLEVRAEERRAHSAGIGDPEMRNLYADRLAQEEMKSEWEREYEQEQYDYAYREEMYQDMFGNYREDYEEDYEEENAFLTRGTYAEELAKALQRDPAFLLPSEAQEAEWEQQAEEWEAQDSAAGKEL